MILKDADWDKFICVTCVVVFIGCAGVVGLAVVNYVTADFETEIVIEDLSYISDETVLELYANFLSGTSGSYELKLIYRVSTSDGIQIHTKRLENNKVFIREENTTNPRIETYIKHRMGKLYLFRDYCNPFASERIKTIYIIPYGTVKNNFEIDYK